MFYYLVYFAVLVRTVLYWAAEGVATFHQLALLVLFFLLSPIQHRLGTGGVGKRSPNGLPVRRRSRVASTVWLVVQAMLVPLLLLSEPYQDYFALLYIGLSVSVVRLVPPGRQMRWLAAFCIATAAPLFVSFGFAGGMTFLPVYIAGIVVIGLYSRANRRAQEARDRSERLTTELKEANRRLRLYADQAEEAATVQERTRLARELHDAVTQTIFGMKLTAEAARLACESKPDEIPSLLDRVQELAGEALGEMRALLDKLRPLGVTEKGLIPILESHIAVRRGRDGLTITLETTGDESGPVDVREAVFRTVQEALNNVARHAAASRVKVAISFRPGRISGEIADDGAGFDPGAPRRPTSYGLGNMRERVAALGGEFSIDSASGKGTTIHFSVPIDAGGTE